MKKLFKLTSALFEEQGIAKAAHFYCINVA